MRILNSSSSFLCITAAGGNICFPSRCPLTTLQDNSGLLALFVWISIRFYSPLRWDNQTGCRFANNDMFGVKMSGYLRVNDRKWDINVEIVKYCFTSFNNTYCHQSVANRAGPLAETRCSATWGTSNPEDLLGYNCSTNVIVNFNRLWPCSQFLQHNDSS